MDASSLISPHGKHEPTCKYMHMHLNVKAQTRIYTYTHTHTHTTNKCKEHWLASISAVLTPPPPHARPRPLELSEWARCWLVDSWKHNPGDRHDRLIYNPLHGHKSHKTVKLQGPDEKKLDTNVVNQQM